MNLGILFFRKRQNVSRLFYKITAFDYSYQQALIGVITKKPTPFPSVAVTVARDALVSVNADAGTTKRHGPAAPDTA
ncbi:hypothetical protein CE195_06325 [Sodalis-like symbiont of Philaenus spumarius]|nr:hypothetical protein CE195_06325 [Sodalis-like symbiont of Philaenus spumarius]